MRLFIFGAGYSGQAIARRLRGEAEWIGGTTRSSEKFERLSAAGIEPFLFDGTELSPPDALARTTHLIASIAPGEGGDPVLRALPDILGRMPALRWIGYLSTVGVYGDHGGAWVDEESECRPASRRSVLRLAAEAEWLGLGQRAGLPVAVLRLSGIYGPGRNAFVNLQNGSAKRIVKPGQVFNRIHVEDIAGATALLAGTRSGGLFNVTDDEPAPPQDVVEHAARLMGVAPPPAVPFKEAELSAMARSFYGENKRVSNQKIKAAGYRFAYPSYREALESMCRSGERQA
jgi:nucleoside-diphosphate-sugar epimerase